MGSTADRRAFRLLLLPFVVMALALAILPALHTFPTLRDLITATPQVALIPVPDLEQLPSRTPDAATTAFLAPADDAIAPAPKLLPNAKIAVSTATLVPTGPRDETTPAPPAFASVGSQPTVPQVEIDRSGAPLVQPVALALPTAAPRPNLDLAAPGQPHLSNAAPILAGKPLPAIGPRAVPLRDRPLIAALSPVLGPALLQPLPPRPYETACPVSYGSAAPPTGEPEAPTVNLSFGVRLATAAAAQTRAFVIYDDKYRPMPRSGGDVPPLYGVCTDVIVRAYRALGIDLQPLVQASRVGAGDPNIDHRRTETLRRYLARYGQSLPVTPHGEDYQPGDIVTYWRPQNSGSRSHIAVVSAKLGPSGRPMIIHNRGWGPQMEDALFVDRITGHYRYDASVRPPLPPQLATSKSQPLVITRAAIPAALRAGSAAGAPAGKGL